MNDTKFLAEQEQRIEDAFDQANHRARQELAQQRDEIRRLSEQRKALKEIERLKRNGRPVPPLLLEQAFGRVEFKSAGATRKR
jgi:hypothetical protein